jgi:hypothetical protein
VEIADQTYAYFESIHRDVFAGDPACNPSLAVEVVGPEELAGHPTLVLITPWTLNGMVFGELADFPSTLSVGARAYPVFAHSLPKLGPYRSINLVPDVSSFGDQESARKAARAYLQPFRNAVAKAIEDMSVGDRDRRDLLRGFMPKERDDPASR